MSAFVEAMAKHLPPSSTALCLLDVGGHTGETLVRLRADLDIVAVPLDPSLWTLPDAGVDAITVYLPDLSETFLDAALAALRSGGRLVMAAPDAQPDAALVERLEAAGYVRILVEPAVNGTGVLMRGEKPHTTADTLERIQQVAEQDAALTEFATYRGRYVHLLIQQTPNKPVWKLQPGEQVEWRAVALRRGDSVPALLAFSSLPAAVGFMQPAVMNGRIKDVNKVAKFSRETVQSWATPLLLNPPLETLASGDITLLSVDRAAAEAPDE